MDVDWFQLLTRGAIPLVGAAWLLVLQVQASNRERRLALFMAQVNGDGKQNG